MLRSLFTQITRLSLRFKWITIVLTLILLVLGVVAGTRLNQEFLPNIEFPQTFVVTFRSGASSEDMRDLVTIPLEKAFSQVRGVIPAGLESTTAGPVSFLTVRNQYGLNQQVVRADLQAAIQRVIDDGVPVGLKTTADLTPEIVTKVLTQAPSMWKHFESRHLLAMQPDVLNAALAVNPDFINQIDLLARDQLAAERVSAAVTGKATVGDPVQLPAAWRLTTDPQSGGLPRIITFNLSNIPVLTASVSSNDPNITPEQLKELVQRDVVDKLKEIDGVANVTLSGGQQIPPDVVEAAKRAIAQNTNGSNGNGGGNGSAPAAPTPAPVANPITGGGTPTNSGPTVPALPDSWRQTRLGPLTLPNPLLTLLKQRFGITVKFDTAADLRAAKDANGQTLCAAALFNRIAEIENANNILRDLPNDVLAYLRQNEPDFTSRLSDGALDLVSSGVLASGPWEQIGQQAGFKEAGLVSLIDLAKIKGSVAQTLNAIVQNTPADLTSFAVRIVDALTPEAVVFLERKEPGFASSLEAQVLRYMSAETLKALPAGFIDGLQDAALRDELKAIIADPSKSAGAALNTNGADAGAVPDDPNAPELPAVWQAAPGLSLKQADDLLKKPYGLSAAGFINAAANSPQGGAALIRTLTPEILLYLQSRDPNFFDELAPSTLKMLTKETLAALPPGVQARTSDFTPTTTVTRANQRESLILSLNKDAEANTVAVSDRVDELLKEVQVKDPQIQINTIFEQASFIKESIEGVVREGSLGAIGAVLVILFFLHFSVRSTLVTAVSIPTSIAIALAMMYWIPPAVHAWLITLPENGLTRFLLQLFPENITLNIMTLSGLTVAIGRVVDDAIVVLENIYRQVQKGTQRPEAVIKGTRDVSVAIFAATLTTVVVFLPIGLTGGVIGAFFLPFGLAVTYALAASFVVAITIVPVLAFLFLDSKHMPAEKEGRLEKFYHGAIKWALSNRAAVLGLAAVSLIIGMALFATRPTTFLPSLGEPQISISVSMPPNTPLAQTDARVRQFEEYLATKQSDGISKYQVTIGSGGSFGDIAAAIGGGGRVNGARASITAAVNVTGEALSALTQEVRAKAGEIFGVDNVTVSRASISEQGFGGFAVVVSGPESELRALDTKVIETLRAIPGLTNISSSLSLVGDAQSYLRVGGVPAVQYSAELEVTDTLGVTRQAIQAVRAIPDLPPTVTVGEGFQSQQQTEGFAQTFGAMGIAVLAVYAVMLFTFGSIIHPFTILFSLPLAVVGAALLLTITNRVVGISALVGMLMLIGIVVTNAIVLIDRVQQNRKDKGMGPREALIEGGRTRLRPILMTAIATMVALSPLALGLSKGAIIATELGTVVIGGLFSSTLLTLLVVPVVYSLFDAAQRRLFGSRSN